MSGSTYQRGDMSNRQREAGIELRRGSRLDNWPVFGNAFLSVRHGVLALEALPLGGRRQVLDFFIAGDVIPTSLFVLARSLYIRVLAPSALCGIELLGGSSQGQRLVDYLGAHLGRRNLHQIMISQLDADARVATFLVALALRTCGSIANDLTVALPMSRNDIADYLAMNPDTLSRIMTRYEALGILRRVNRHAVRLHDADELARRGSLVQLIQPHDHRERRVSGRPIHSEIQPVFP